MTMEHTTAEISFLPNEYWYGGAVNDGYRFPLSERDTYELNIDFNDTYNQINPVYVSSKGRYLWLDGGKIKFSQGKIFIETQKYELNEEGSCLKDAVIRAAKKYYPPTQTIPDETAFLQPQFCTWMTLGTNQTQSGVLECASRILKKGIRPGIFIIDDGWQEDYGEWNFRKDKFEDPLQMCKTLKSWGFKIVLWMVPYISFNAKAFAQLKEHDALIKDEAGNIYEAEWWNGRSAVLDLKNGYALNFLKENTSRLRREYGIDGFKLDGGDSQYLDKRYEDGNLQNIQWISSYEGEIKEARACYKLAGQPIIQRLADKAHIWGVEFVEDQQLPDRGYLKYGLQAVLPQMLTQGVTGYYYGCPDMVGGGLLCDIEKKKSSLDMELIIRSCALSSMMPMIQFSFDLWDIEDIQTGKRCLNFIKNREKYTDYILELAKNASVTSEPILRYLEYEFPFSGLEEVTDEAMLGEKYLIAPILHPGQREKTVVFPPGDWKDAETGKIYREGKHSVEAPLDVILVFEKLN